MHIVAITGSIGCGKSTLAGLVRQTGYPVFDADKWCRRLYFEKEFLAKIRANFPFVFKGEKFDKRALRNFVFANPEELKKLEKLTHPFLKHKFLNVIHHYAKSDNVIFIDVAILFEMGWDKYCTYIIVADTDRETQKQRVMTRDNVSAEDFERIVNLQMNNRDKIKKADAVIETNRPLGVLKTQLIEIVNGLS